MSGVGGALVLTKKIQPGSENEVLSKECMQYFTNQRYLQYRVFKGVVVFGRILPVGFFFCRIFFTTVIFGYCPRSAIQPHDGFITQWVFSFLPLQLSRILSADSHSATGRDYGSAHIVGFFFFTTNHTTLNGSTRWGGSPLRPLPWAQSLILTVHGLGLIPPDIPTGPHLHL